MTGARETGTLICRCGETYDVDAYPDEIGKRIAIVAWMGRHKDHGTSTYSPAPDSGCSTLYWITTFALAHV